MYSTNVKRAAGAITSCSYGIGQSATVVVVVTRSTTRIQCRLWSPSDAVMVSDDHIAQSEKKTASVVVGNQKYDHLR